jgi:hypothetical protein
MKTVLAALALAALVAAPAFITTANAANDRVGGFQSTQGSYTGTYMGQPLKNWYTVDRY